MKFFQCLYLAMALLCNQSIANDNCRQEMQGHGYLIGYGSLMNEKSLHSSIKDADSIEPIIVKGFSRSFNFNVNIFGLKTSMLSVVEASNEKINASLIGIDKHDLDSLDARESGYCRKEVSRESLKFYNDDKLSTLDGPIWIYVSNSNDEEIKDEYKVPQSYVDVFLGGCLEMEEAYALVDFAKECVLTTNGWEQKQFVNDRIHPRRPWVYHPLAMKVDKLLDELVPEVILRRKIES